jgi:hypothetical protein
MRAMCPQAVRSIPYKGLLFAGLFRKEGAWFLSAFPHDPYRKEKAGSSENTDDPAFSRFLSV